MILWSFSGQAISTILIPLLMNMKSRGLVEDNKEPSFHTTADIH